MAARLESDLWPALWNYWHPVVHAADVSEKPVAVKLLEQRLVVARLEDRLACFRDLCVHRGTPLSLGWVDGDQLVCGYHGWRYDVSGACTCIPALPCDHPIPRRARVEAFRVEQRYGIIWVCLGEPVAPIPEFVGGRRSHLPARLSSGYHLDGERCSSHREFRRCCPFPLGPRKHPRHTGPSGGARDHHHSLWGGAALCIRRPPQPDAPGVASPCLPHPPAVHYSPAKGPDR